MTVSLAVVALLVGPTMLMVLTLPGNDVGIGGAVVRSLSVLVTVCYFIWLWHW